MNECKGQWITTTRLDETPSTDHLTGIVDITDQNGNNIAGFFIPDTGPQVPLLGGKCRRLGGTLHALSFQFEIPGGDTFGLRGLIDTAGNPDRIICGSVIVITDAPEDGDTGTWQASKSGPLTGGKKGSKKGGSKATKRKGAK